MKARSLLSTNLFQSVLIGIIFGTLLGCSVNQVEELVVYKNTYEEFSPLNQFNIDNTFTIYHRTQESYFDFNGSRNFGRFETGGFTQVIEGLKDHQYVKIEFDFFVHDKWEGNGEPGVGEDVLIFNIDNSSIHFSSIINTKCLDRNCEAMQSFPATIGLQSNPENAGVFDPTLPGVCHFKDEIGGSKQIKISKLFPHVSEELRVTIASGIKNAGPDLCLKSWSVDNLKISTINLAKR